MIKGILIATAILGGNVVEEKTKEKMFDSMDECIVFIADGVEDMKNRGVKIKTYNEDTTKNKHTVEATGKFLFFKLTAIATCEKG